MITTNLTLNERFDWLKENHPMIPTPLFGISWSDFVDQKIKADMYSFAFNHPYYVGEYELTDDELRHSLLDDLNVPRTI